MEQKTKALKVASKIISIITKIGYTVMMVMVDLCAAMLAYLAISGEDTSVFKLGSTNIVLFDEIAATPSELAGICAVLLVMGGMLFTIFLLTSRLFHGITLTGDPFERKYVKSIRAIGILTAATPVAVGITEGIVTLFTKTELPEFYTDLPGIVVGAIIFCLSFIIDYGCALKEKSWIEPEGKTAQ